jgi:hypothetical protein
VNASLVAIGNTEDIRFNLNFELPDENISPELERTSDFNVAGGGNIVLVEPGTGGIHPVVLDQDGVLTDRLSSSVMASTLLQEENVDQAGLDGAQFFDYIKTHDALVEIDRVNTFGRANVASQGDSFRPDFDGARFDTVVNGGIIRSVLYDLFGPGMEDSKRRDAIDTAAVFVDIDPVLGEVLTATNIQD